MRRLIAILFLMYLSIASFPTSAFAHAQLVYQVPASGAKLDSVPELVRIEFDGNLQVFEGKNLNVLVVQDSSGRQVDSKDSVVGGARLTVTLKDRSGEGKFHVSYRVVSEDGHPVEGDYYFFVNGGEATINASTQSMKIVSSSPVEPSKKSVKKSRVTSNPQNVSPTPGTSKELLPKVTSPTEGPVSSNSPGTQSYGVASPRESFFHHHWEHLLLGFFALIAIGIWWGIGRGRSI